MATLLDARADVVRRLNDAAHTYWTASEIDRYLRQAYLELARVTRAIWDIRYAENLPVGFTYTWKWEEDYADFKDGVANFTSEFERTLLTESQRLGPATHTSPFEANNGHDSGPIPALAELPETVCDIDRPMSDWRAIAVMRPAGASRYDSRYELTEGQVEALVTTQNGLRTIRKIRVPSERCDAYTIEGSWGVCRDTTDISDGEASGGETTNRMFARTVSWEAPYQQPSRHSVPHATYTASWESSWATTLAGSVAHATPAVSGGPSNHTYSHEYTIGVRAGLTMTEQTWYSVPRRIPGHHPMGSDFYGLCRRPYNDTNNVRIEHWREGRAVSEEEGDFELPAGADAYLRDYALYRCYERIGPAQDKRMAQHYETRWQRGVSRVTRRVTAQQRQRVGQFGGGDVRSMRKGPPRPTLPWQFGVVVR